MTRDMVSALSETLLAAQSSAPLLLQFCLPQSSRVLTAHPCFWSDICVTVWFGAVWNHIQEDLEEMNSGLAGGAAER